MMPDTARKTNVLAEIVAHKAKEVAKQKLELPLADIQEFLPPSTRSLQQALSHSKSDFILECKKASPSKGLIREDFDLNQILDCYQDYASAISILTDKKYFQGEHRFIQQAREKTNLPLLCKDFFIDPYQVYLARYYGADAILLMLSVLNDDEYRQLATVANSLNLDILTEVHDETELDRAISLDAKIIGINNRDLKSLNIDLANTEKLAVKVPKDRIVISESGIESHQDVKRLSNLVQGFLVGSSIMAQSDIRFHCKSLIFGNVKICGITDVIDAKQVDLNGGNFAGFIFYPKSKRNVSLETAQSIVNQVTLNYVGVFVDESIDKMVDYATQLSLHAVQLHGNESSSMINQLRQLLPSNCEIWKAIHVGDEIKLQKTDAVDRYLLDTKSEEVYGGSGERFNWDLLESLDFKSEDLNSLILAGGINLSNLLDARKKNTYAIDLSSGVEDSPGIKNHQKIQQLFTQLRA